MRKVLVVDDEKLIVKGIKFSLEQDEMQVDCAYDGEEALEKAKENQYDIILLEVMLPGLTGFEVCQAILEVKARIKAILRRSAHHDVKEEESAKVVECRGLKIDCESRRVHIHGKEVNLTAKEFDLLELLVFHPNKVYSREDLLNTVWGYDYPGDARTVDVHIRRLREKIEVNPGVPDYVHTKWGVGYYFQS